MRPLFSYYGGKQRMSSKIIPLIPKHTVYVEPFAGGASVFFAKPWPKITNTHHYREVLNDTNKDIFNLYKIFQDKEKAEKLIHRLEFTLYSREEYKISKEKTDCEIENACRFYVNIQKSFANKYNSGFNTGVYGRNLAKTWSTKIEGLKEYLERMSAVTIECEDALKVIKRWDSPQTFFYCDPPYPNAHQGHYKGYTIDDYKNLIKTLNECKGSFLLSNYNQDIEIPSDWEKFEFKSHASSSGKGTTGSSRDTTKKATKDDLGNRDRIEIVYRRFNKVPVREEIRELYLSGKYDCFADKDNNLSLPF